MAWFHKAFWWNCISHRKWFFQPALTRGRDVVSVCTSLTREFITFLLGWAGGFIWVKFHSCLRSMLIPFPQSLLCMHRNLHLCTQRRRVSVNMERVIVCSNTCLGACSRHFFSFWGEYTLKSNFIVLSKLQKQKGEENRRWYNVSVFWQKVTFTGRIE